jgi:hypothetical protein
MTLSPEERSVQENQAITQVTVRMKAKFPQVDPRLVDDVVREEHDAFAGHPIRDYVPVLVERQVKARLRAGTFRSLETIPA